MPTQAEIEAAKDWFRGRTLDRLLAQRRDIWPADFYEPHEICLRGPRAGKPSGQLQFHESTHQIRGISTGNRWGGTSAMAAEIDAWMRHTCKWQQTPPWPIIAVWYCVEFRQLALVLKDLTDLAFGAVPRFTDSGIGGPRLIWPDGGTLYFASYDRSWKTAQGTNPDLFAFDENPPEKLWMECQQRYGGKRDTRFMFKATQSEGLTWMAQMIYRPWKEHHEALGIMDEEDMLVAQKHPDTWLWTRGGIHDNPNCSDKQVEAAERRVWRSVKEKRVRLFGGFLSFVGDPVFDEEAMERMQQAADAYKPYLKDATIMALTEDEIDAIEEQKAAQRAELPPLATW